MENEVGVAVSFTGLDVHRPLWAGQPRRRINNRPPPSTVTCGWHETIGWLILSIDEEKAHCSDLWTLESVKNMPLLVEQPSYSFLLLWNDLVYQKELRYSCEHMDNNTSTTQTPVTQPGTTIPNTTQVEKSYDGWLISNSFVKRALAVTGYAIVGQFIVYAILLIPLYFIASLVSFFN